MGLAGWRQRTGRARGRLLEEQRARGFADRDGDRAHPTDWFPRLVPADEWARIEGGLGQRARAINEFLRRLEAGTEEVVPREVIGSSTLYDPAVPTRFGEVPAPHIGFDLVAVEGDGGSSWEYLVIEDNIRMPVGAMAMTRLRALVPEIFPDSFVALGVRPLGDALARIGEAARAASPRPDPTIAILSDGPSDRYYLDHALLADGADALLAERGEVRLDGDGLVHGPSGRTIDVLYERLEKGRLWDELPEIVEAHRDGRVWIFFPPNVGIADDKGVYPFVPDMIRTYLGEEPLVANVPTYSLAVEEDRRQVMDRFGELVVKGRAGWGGKDVFIAPAEPTEAVEAFRRKVEADPMAYVAQELVDFSTHVLCSEDGGQLVMRDSYADLRVHAISLRPGEAEIPPGSLTRLAAPGSRKVNVSGGGSVKDTWVLTT